MSSKQSSPQQRRTRIAPRGTLFRGSLHDSLTEALRGKILRHELKPGEWLQEMELCEELGVSRTPLREALKVLAAEKLVTLYPYRGASVTEIDPDAITGLLEVQSILESQAGLLACSRASDDALASYSRTHALMMTHFERGDRDAYFALNQDLHEMIVAMSGNNSLVEIHASLMTQIKRARYLALDIEHRWEESVAQHVEIHDALMARRSDIIAELIRHHVLDTSRAVVSGVKQAFELRRTTPAPAA